MNKELLEALEILEKEKNISKEIMLEAIEKSLLTACSNHFGKADNIKVNINPDTCDFGVIAEKEVVEEVEDPVTQISLADAKMIGVDMALVMLFRFLSSQSHSEESQLRMQRM